MSEKIDPVTGNIVGMSGSLGNRSVQISAEQRQLAEDKTAWRLAQKIYDWARNPEGGTWFTKWKLNLTPGEMSIVHRGTDLGLWKRHPDKPLWRHTPFTWPWLLTSMALRDEWEKSPEAQRIRDAITPKNHGNGIHS